MCQSDSTFSYAWLRISTAANLSSVKGGWDALVTSITDACRTPNTYLMYIVITHTGVIPMQEKRVPVSLTLESWPESINIYNLDL